MKTGNARILSVLLVFVLLFSLFFIVAEAGHDCASDDCAICRIVAVAEDVLKKTALLFCAFVILAAACLAAGRTLPVFAAASSSFNPVLLKVKLSN